jgi:hypothetical protein
MIAAACGVLLFSSTAAVAVQIKAGRSYQGQIVACGSEQEADTLLGFAVSGDLDKAKKYLEVDDNTCGVGSARFIPTRTDPSGNAWKIVKIELPHTEAFLVTTADFLPGKAT